MALLVLSLVEFSASAALETNEPAKPVASMQARERPFVVFPITKWYPTRPRSQASADAATLIALLGLPVMFGWTLLAFYRRAKSKGAAPSWSRLLAGNGLMLLLLLLCVLLCCELYFRFFVDTTDAIGFTKISERWIARHWHSNVAGCRDSIEYHPRIQSQKRRLTFIGDSFTAGHGIKDVEARFANRLRAIHPDWEVHVLANVGLDTGAQLRLLNKALYRGYEFDEVVLVYCLNDVGDLLISAGGPFEGKLPSADQVGPWFTRGSYFLDLFYNRHKVAQNPLLRDYFSFAEEGYKGLWWEIQKSRLRELKDIVHKNGGRLSVVTFPFLHSLGADYRYDFVHERLNNFWIELQVPHLDLLPVYRSLASSEITVNAHDAHPNERASELAAKQIDQVLWPVFQSRATPSKITRSE